MTLTVRLNPDYYNKPVYFGEYDSNINH